MQANQKDLIQDCPYCTTLREKAKAFNAEYSKLLDFGRQVPNVNDLKIECDACKDTGLVLTDYGRQVRTVLLGDVRKLIEDAYHDLGLDKCKEEDSDVFEPCP